MTEAQKPAPSRLLPWVVAIGLGIPLALIAWAASPFGPNFFYVVVEDPCSLISMGNRGSKRFHRKHSLSDAKEMEAMCHRRHFAGRSAHCRV
jgi:hypothetical protein